MDSGAFIAAERWDRDLKEWLVDAVREHADILVPAGVVAEIWRNPARPQSTRLLAGTHRIVALDADRARAVGSLLGRAGSTQVVDASVAELAIEWQPCLILTSDAADIAAILSTAGVRFCIGDEGRAPIRIEPI